MVLFLVISLNILRLNTIAVSASVTLLYFLAEPEDGSVFLEWETATEIDSAGFYVSRSTAPDNNFERIGVFIPTQGDPITGAYYSYRDESLQNGITYYYILESWDYDNTVDYTDPIAATPGMPAATTTLTATSTSTLTPTSDIQPSPTETEEPTAILTASNIITDAATVIFLTIFLRHIRCNNFGNDSSKEIFNSLL